MKLRNKKTGEIIETLTKISFVEKQNNGLYASKCKCFDSIDLLNEEWEDYEEPKKSFYLTAWGEVKEYSKEPFNLNHKLEIGNYFESKEEAEKAVEKLKAWKRLKKCDFKFEGYEDRDRAEGGDIVIYAHIDTPHNNMLEEAQPAMLNDLDLLFGGENE